MIMLIFIVVGIWLLPWLVTYLHIRAISPVLLAFLLGGIWLVVSLPFLSSLLDRQERQN